MATNEIEPHSIHDGLAVYDTGQGRPVFLMPYPHGFPVVPTVEGALAMALRELEPRVISFDPPDAFRSTRPAQVSMAEMPGCAEETLQTLGVQAPLPLIGHSMGGVCALAYTLAHPERVSKLVLVGSVSGWPAIIGSQGGTLQMKLTDLDLWRFAWWGMQLSTGRGNLAMHKKMVRLLWKKSYVNQDLIPELKISSGDARLSAPVRDRWPSIVRRLDYGPQLPEIKVSTLVIVGRYDPQAPVICSQELAGEIPGAQLAIFENSGHYPFIEEKELFLRVLKEFSLI